MRVTMSQPGGSKQCRSQRRGAILPDDAHGHQGSVVRSAVGDHEPDKENQLLKEVSPLVAEFRDLAACDFSLSAQLTKRRWSHLLAPKDELGVRVTCVASLEAWTCRRLFAVAKKATCLELESGSQAPPRRVTMHSMLGLITFFLSFHPIDHWISEG